VRLADRRVWRMFRLVFEVYSKHGQAALLIIVLISLDVVVRVVDNECVALCLVVSFVVPNLEVQNTL
jgi:hypothetical protein